MFLSLRLADSLVEVVSSERWISKMSKARILDFASLA